MLTTDARKHRSAGFRVVSVACAMMTVLGTAGVTRPVAAADRIQPPPYDRRVLSEIARDVLRNGATGANQSVAEPSLPGGMPGLKPEPDSTVADTEPDEAMTATDIAPAREGITVPIDRSGSPAPEANPRGGGGGGRLSLQFLATADRYRAGAELLVGPPGAGVRARPGSRRPHPRPARRGSPARVRLSPAARPGRRGPPEQAGRSRRGATRPARRPPQGPSPDRVAPGDRGDAGGRVGRRERAVAEAELGAERAPGWQGPGRRGRSRRLDPDRHQSLRRRRQRELPASTGGRRRHARAVRCRPSLLSRGGHRSGHRHDHRLRLRPVRGADRAGAPNPRREHAAHRRRPDPPGHDHVWDPPIRRLLDPGRHHGLGLPDGRERARRSVLQGGVRPELHRRRPQRVQRPARPRHARAGHHRRYRERQQPLPGHGSVRGTPRRRRHQGRQDLQEGRQRARRCNWQHQLDNGRDGLDDPGAGRVWLPDAVGRQLQRRR